MQRVEKKTKQQKTWPNFQQHFSDAMDDLYKSQHTTGQHYQQMNNMNTDKSVNKKGRRINQPDHSNTIW